MPRTMNPGNGSVDRPKPKRPQAQPNGATDSNVNSDEIARRAYEIYQSRGAQHGSDLDHWLEAERELKPGPTSVTGSISAAKPKKAKKTPQADV
jgi:DUF2934 family protein